MKVKFSDICIITSSKRIFESEYVESGIPFIRGQEISDGSILDENASFECYISQERYNEIKSKYYVPKLGDILITAVGTIGNLCYIDKIRDFYFKDGNVILFTAFAECVYSKYLFYYMKSPIFKKQLEYALIGAVQKALTIVMLNEIEIDLPNIETQKSIVEVLDKIDSKILINNRINAELESMTKTIYDYWFTQFDFPDENGKPYRSSGGKMVWNEELKREIPEGWRVVNLSSFINVIRGVSYSPDDVITEPKENYVPLLKSNNLQNGKLILDDIIYVPKANVMNNQYLSNNSIFITMSSGSSEHVGKTAIISFDTKYCYGAFCSKIDIKPEFRCFISSFFLSDYFKRLIRTTVIGTSIKNISNEHLINNLIAIPSDKSIDIISRFEKNINPMFDKQGEIIRENQQLASLRNWLLPMLINGQISFKEKQEENPQTADSGFEQWLTKQGYAARGDVNMDVLRVIYEAIENDDK